MGSKTDVTDGYLLLLVNLRVSLLGLTKVLSSYSFFLLLFSINSRGGAPLIAGGSGYTV